MTDDEAEMIIAKICLAILFFILIAIPSGWLD